MSILSAKANQCMKLHNANVIEVISAQGKGTKTKMRAFACPYIFMEIFYGNTVSGQLRFSVDSLNADVYLTHPC